RIPCGIFIPVQSINTAALIVAEVIKRTLFNRQIRGQSSPRAPVLFVDIVKENVERLGFDVDDLLEISGDPFDELLFLQFASPFVHVDLHDWHIPLRFVLKSMNANLSYASATSQGLSKHMEAFR